MSVASEGFPSASVLDTRMQVLSDTPDNIALNMLASKRLGDMIAREHDRDDSVLRNPDTVWFESDGSKSDKGLLPSEIRDHEIPDMAYLVGQRADGITLLTVIQRGELVAEDVIEERTVFTLRPGAPTQASPQTEKYIGGSRQLRCLEVGQDQLVAATTLENLSTRLTSAFEARRASSVGQKRPLGELATMLASVA